MHRMGAIMYRNCALLVPNMMKNGVGENMGGLIYSWWFPYWTTCPWVNVFHSAHFVVIGVVLGGRVYKLWGKGLLLHNLLPINGENVYVSWLIGRIGVIYFGFLGVEFVSWVNIYPPLIASAMDMKSASDRTWRILKRCARTSLVVELKYSSSSQVSQIIHKFFSFIKFLWMLSNYTKASNCRIPHLELVKGS